MEWLKRLGQAIEYVEDNLTGEISYQQAANIACCSEGYFLRMFSYVADISLSEYIRRRKMTQAAFELQTTDGKVMDIALKYGYSSPTSFNRAFQAVHGVSPSLARSQGILLNAFPPIRFAVTVIGGEAMAYRIETKEAMRMVGVRIPLKRDMEIIHKLVPEFWAEVKENGLFDRISALSGQSPQGIIGMSDCADPDAAYYYIAAATDSAVPEGMVAREIPASAWAVFACNGRFKESVQSIFKRFITEWLPFSGYEYAELPDLEIYPIEEKKQNTGYSEVWIGIKKEN